MVTELKFDTSQLVWKLGVIRYDRLMTDIFTLALPKVQQLLIRKSPVGTSRTFSRAWVTATEKEGGMIVGWVRNTAGHAQYLVRAVGPWRFNPWKHLLAWVRKFVGGTDAHIASVAYAIGVVKMRSTTLPQIRLDAMRPLFAREVEAITPRVIQKWLRENEKKGGLM